jgi:NAD dependent epimerase/dehydratase family enzyme
MDAPALQRNIVNGADAVINLSGASLGDGRWTPQRKAVLHDSRILPTRSLAAAITESAARPPVFIQRQWCRVLPRGQRTDHREFSGRHRFSR